MSKILFKFYRSVVAFYTDNQDRKVITVFTKVLYTFLFIKILLLKPTFDICQEYFNPDQDFTIGNLLINFFSIPAVKSNQNLIITLGLGLVIWRFFRESYWLGLLIFWFHLNFFAASIKFMDGADRVMNILVFASAFINVKGRADRDLTQILKVGLSKAAVFGIKLQICLVYLYSGLDKLLNESWRSGHAAYKVLNLDYFIHPWLNGLISSENHLILGSLSWAIILFEVLFPILIWFSAIRLPLLLGGLMLHLFIAIFLSLPDFGLVMLMPYLLFLKKNELELAFNRVSRFFPKRNQQI